ncbi:MAG: NADH:ubiquinone oxidoreductase subunit J [Rickettsiales bacterium]|nr:NADH:ubiquinone oxidoreductase subunit J [Rickettsiales bacterium]|tara:strand:- start:329 stop:928 length:600 start_codon:yes stop_codon:yes gene_type:complete
MFSLFGFFSLILIFSSLMVILSRNTVYSVLYLILSFFNAAIIFLMSNAEFLAMTLIIVYVGAVAVLFLFVVMMLNINVVKAKEGMLKYLPFGLVLISVLLIELSLIFSDLPVFPESSTKIDISALINNGNSNTKAIGLHLYTDYFIIFQISGFVLLVAMLGAIVLAYQKNENYISQDVLRQLDSDRKKSIKLNDIEPNR